MVNAFFALTEEFNSDGVIALLAARSYLAEFRATVPIEVPLEEQHAVAVRLAERSLPTTLEEAAS
jgi:hypothetical protein